MSDGPLPERSAPPPEPADFDAFWRTTREELTRAPLAWRVHRRYDDPGLDRWVEELSFDSSTGERAFAWVTYQREGQPTRGMVVSHGYQGRADGPDEHVPVPYAAKIFPCAPGLPRSLSAAIPAVTAEHVLHGISSRDTYVHRFCVADIWRAASVLLERFPGIEQLDYSGGSFGGGIGALALPWDDRFRRAHLSLPSFGHHPLRLRVPCTGSGEAVRHRVAREPELRTVLGYFDAATAATRIRIPTFVSVARRDSAVPPVGQFAVYHALGGPKRLYLLSAGHTTYPGQASELAARDRELATFFA
ncbi:acetylxylan esterase [Phytohabitans kaempferiae]|uniref:Acetylxylan esterase n=1 Tax=Phytohabitans kaempferiae TaxID=1620943 RepID=A0ABV6M518_9ACTN